MLPTDRLILVCAGADAAYAAAHGLPLLQFCLGASTGGALTRLCLPARTSGCYLGLADRGLHGRLSSGTAEAILYEAKKQGMAGVFADFECTDSAAQELITALDRILHHAGLAFFVPLCQADYTENAFLVAETAVSGGSLDEYFFHLQHQYGARIAASLRPVSVDFLLPSADSDGISLSSEQRRDLLSHTGAQAFFSRELCARYFTYMDSAGSGHFVLFDDDDTLEAKVSRLHRMDIPFIFALYPDVCHLLSQSHPPSLHERQQ